MTPFQKLVLRALHIIVVCTCHVYHDADKKGQLLKDLADAVKE